jgi:hypothetical protein
MRAIYLTPLMILAAGVSAVAKTPSSADDKSIVGWVEYISIPQINVRLKAKLDTGAKTSSIDATIIGIHGPNNKPETDEAEDEDASSPAPAEGPENMQGQAAAPGSIPTPPDISARKNPEDTIVVFSIKDQDSKEKTLQRKLVRWVKIKKKEGGILRRPVVRMTFCIGGRKIRDEVNLAQRDHFIYPVLIGRNMLGKGDFLMDPARTFVSRSGCPKDARDED